MIGLFARFAGGLFGEWIDPALKMTLMALIAMVLIIGAARFWPRGDDDAVAVAVTAAAGQRDAIEAAHRDEEGRDNAWIEKLQALRQAEREAAAKAGGDDAVVFLAADSWLRAKFSASR